MFNQTKQYTYVLKIQKHLFPMRFIGVFSLKDKYKCKNTDWCIDLFTNCNNVYFSTQQIACLLYFLRSPPLLVTPGYHW